VPQLPNLSLVIGAASSGKSNWAEDFCIAAPHTPIYIATAQAFDAEMVAKIARHRKNRDDRWQTIEAPLNLVTPLLNAGENQIILVDCLTMWLSNHLLAQNDISAESDQLVNACKKLSCPTVLVTNEVGASVVPDNPLARRFQSEQGRLNQRIAAISDLVINVICGLPLCLKGTLPGGRI